MFALDPVTAFWQIQRRGKVAQLADGKRDCDGFIRHIVNLTHHHTFGIGLNDDILLQGRVRFALIDQSDHGGVEFMLYGEHRKAPLPDQLGSR